MLFRQFNDAAGHALQLPDVLTAFADDTTDLGAGHEDLNSQSNVFGARDISFLPHLLKDQVLGLPLRFRGADDSNLPFGLLLGRLVLFERRDLDAGSGEPDNVTNVGALGADDGADAIVGNV